MENMTLLGNKWDLENPPSFEPLFFENFDDTKWKHFMAENWKLPFYVSAVYLVVIFSIQYFMKNRTPFKLQGALALWNLALGAFSIMGLIRVAPEFIKILSAPDGFHRSACVREGLNAPSATWALLFSFSKFFELGDTLFIVLRKQPLIFLQWLGADTIQMYHHCTSMILAWQVVPYSEPIQRYYGFMNYAIHSIMYPYFAMKAMKIYIPRRFSMMITISQLLQMVIGVGVNVYTIYVMSIGQECARDPYSIKLISAIYGSFMILFAEFLYKSYFTKSKKL